MEKRLMRKGFYEGGIGIKVFITKKSFAVNEKSRMKLVNLPLNLDFTYVKDNKVNIKIKTDLRSFRSKERVALGPKDSSLLNITQLTSKSSSSIKPDFSKKTWLSKTSRKIFK